MESGFDPGPVACPLKQQAVCASCDVRLNNLRASTCVLQTPCESTACLVVLHSTHRTLFPFVLQLKHTKSSQVRTCRQGIIDYFTSFLALKPYGRIDKCIIRELAPDVAINSGVYTFKLTRDTGTASWSADCLGRDTCCWWSLSAVEPEQGVVRSASIPERNVVAVLVLLSTTGVDNVQARYTFIYKKIDDRWFISEHHSSAMPEN